MTNCSSIELPVTIVQQWVASDYCSALSCQWLLFSSELPVTSVPTVSCQWLLFQQWAASDKFSSSELAATIVLEVSCQWLLFYVAVSFQWLSVPAVNCQWLSVPAVSCHTVTIGSVGTCVHCTSSVLPVTSSQLSVTIFRSKFPVSTVLEVSFQCQLSQKWVSSVNCPRSEFLVTIVPAVKFPVTIVSAAIATRNIWILYIL